MNDRVIPTAGETAGETSDTLTLLKVLADETRLKLVSILVREDCYVELLASRLELTPATVCYHLKKLEAAGLLHTSRSQFYVIYSLDRTVFDRTLGELIAAAAPVPIEDPDAAYRREVIARFFQYGRLVRIPTQQKKQAIVYAEVAARFTPGVNYTEWEVNALLAEIYDDICTLRRGLISEGLMTRSHEPGGPDIYRRV